MYLVLILLLMIVLPVGSIVAEWATSPIAPPLMPLVGKWFVFWAAGVRLLAAGIKQFFQPEFTAHQIFKMKTDEALPVVRELGVANFAIGVLGVSSAWAPSFVLPVAVAGAIFYGVAGAQHVRQKDKSGNETLAMVTDLLAFLVLAAYVAYVWLS